MRVSGYLPEYPGIYPSMTETIRCGVRVYAHLCNSFHKSISTECIAGAIMVIWIGHSRFTRRIGLHFGPPGAGLAGQPAYTAYGGKSALSLFGTTFGTTAVPTPTFWVKSTWK